jgi:hypothetical protein
MPFLEKRNLVPRANAGSRTESASIPSITGRSMSRPPALRSTGDRMTRPVEIDFQKINAAAIPALAAILARLLPGGKVEGREYAVRNPTRADRRPGSFKINMRTGAWGDFSSGDKGGDPISLVAYVEGVSQIEAMRRLGRMLGIEIREGSR